MHPKTRGTSLTSWSEVTKRNSILSLDKQYSLPWISDHIHPSQIGRPTDAQKSQEQCSLTCLAQVRESRLHPHGSRTAWFRSYRWPRRCLQHPNSLHGMSSHPIQGRNVLSAAENFNKVLRLAQTSTCLVWLHLKLCCTPMTHKAMTNPNWYCLSPL